MGNKISLGRLGYEHHKVTDDEQKYNVLSLREMKRAKGD